MFILVLCVNCIPYIYIHSNHYYQEYHFVQFTQLGLVQLTNQRRRKKGGSFLLLTNQFVCQKPSVPAIVRSSNLTIILIIIIINKQNNIIVFCVDKRFQGNFIIMLNMIQSRIPLSIVHYHLCMEGHLKLRLLYLYQFFLLNLKLEIKGNEYIK